MPRIKESLEKIKSKIDETAAACGRNPHEIRLVCVSKSRSIAEIEEAYEAGIRDFGENRVIEAREKQAILPKDIRWHFIGRLQSNKAHVCIGSFFLLHSIGSIELAKKISALAEKEKKPTSILLQVNCLNEASKQGFTQESCKEALEYIEQLPFIQVKGLMTMAPKLESQELDVAQNSFLALQRLFLELQNGHRPFFQELSMGMSQDYVEAILYGSTYIRIGSSIFTD